MNDRAAYGLKMTILIVLCLAVFTGSFFLGRYGVDFVTVIRILADRFVRIISFGTLSLA